MSAGLQGAIESAPVTRLHEHRSYDPADFAVPTGREEEWRFTPLRRLRGLHGDAPLPAAKVTVEVDPAPEVKTFTAERASGQLGRTFIPADRVSARRNDRGRDLDNGMRGTVIGVDEERGLSVRIDAGEQSTFGLVR